MAWLGLELLLLLVVVQGWEWDDEKQLFKAPTALSDDEEDNSLDISDYDDYDEDADPSVQVEALDYHPGKLGGVTDEEEDTPAGRTSTTNPSHDGLQVVCGEAGFHINLPAGQQSLVKVLGSKDLQPVNPAQETCGVNVTNLQNTLTVPYTGCYVETTNSYSLQLLYVDKLGQAQVATVACDPSLTSDRVLMPRSGVEPTSASKCRTPPPMTSAKAQNCAVTSEQQLPCGQSGISPNACDTMGCCMDPTTSKCFYPMDECTLDKHFVFIIKSMYASMPLDPTELVIPGTSCKPVVVNAKFAIFKFKVTECGTHTYDVGVTRFYLAEVQTLVKALNLKYGIVTRTDPLRFLIECRYSISSNAKQPLASVGYMVKIPSSNLPSSIHSGGLYSVQLKIATDMTYSTFLPSFPTLRFVLDKPVYLELSLWSPKPNAVILVKYCLAYPRSAKNALVLVYKGCANPYDPNVSILQVSDLPRNRHQRRFVVNAFQFMDVTTKKYFDEEILFMCSSEVCWPDETTCEERCFDGKEP
ncbi:zona pellucida sperm-binding protein 4-like [Nerophis lumbriciformis]|uniref:zona pellucida sperm-binding protein 4-like n=1 Tax=Nerophis lumbriciformis TaxID=546530 RepID=UPI002ADFFFA7|nr:zona pellucida sperm-binding protein 4-like [Nerophis lumbriciformis]